MNQDKSRLGVDIGGVLIERIGDKPDTWFAENDFPRSQALPDAFQVLRQLGEKRYGGEIYLISKCGPNIERKTRLWLDRNDFFHKTGINPKHLHFCRRRQDKGPICKQLGITHFVDDRLEVLGYLETVRHKFLFQPVEKEVKRHAHILPKVSRVDSWDELRPRLLQNP